MSKPSPPAAPNYTQAAQAQGASNLEVAQAQGRMNNPNVVGPYGTQNVTWNGNQPTVTQTLSPEQQALYNQSVSTQGQLGQLAGQGASALQGVVGKPVDFSGSPAAPVPGQVNQAIVNAMMQRPTADYNRAVDQSKSDLAAAGIPVTSKAYQTQQDLLGRQLTDAQTQAELAGVGAGQTAFNEGQAARTAANTENLTARQTPINEISALMSGSQVSNPFSTPGYAQNTQVAQTPIYNAAQQAGQYGTDVYNAQSAANSNLTSGLFGLGGSGLLMAGMMSDRRAKYRIRRLWTHPLGIGVYEFWYRPRFQGEWGACKQIGVMADEVRAVLPEAVSTDAQGFDRVDYRRLTWIPEP